MCCFSQPVIAVSGTSIFARAAPEGRQYLAYEMTLRAADDLAMILPLPVRPRAGDDAVTFLDLSGYPTFFSDLTAAFPAPFSYDLSAHRGAAPTGDTLAVVEAGNFEASFVPTVGDFPRLDARFRLPAEVWSQLPGYQRFGFAVFKLKRGERRVHPMAFTFPSARPEALFFPTVHVHDGKVHAEATFDHSLFCQWPALSQPRLGAAGKVWRRSLLSAKHYVGAWRSKGLIDGEDSLWRRQIEGPAPNRDVYLEP